MSTTPPNAYNNTPVCFAEARIRPAVPDDCARLTDLASAAYGLYLDRMEKKPAPMLENYAERIAKGHVFVLEIQPVQPNDKKDDPEAQASFSPSPAGIVGFIVLLPGNDALLLDNLAVDPAMQRRGYGKMLLAFAEETARKTGFLRISLYTNEVMTENLKLYPRLGYTQTRRAVEKGYNRVFFSKTLY